MASSKRQMEQRIEELDEEVDEQAEQIQLLEHVCETLVYSACYYKHERKLTEYSRGQCRCEIRIPCALGRYSWSPSQNEPTYTPSPPLPPPPPPPLKTGIHYQNFCDHSRNFA